jgi:hypothetical protein
LAYHALNDRERLLANGIRDDIVALFPEWAKANGWVKLADDLEEEKEELK